ncbi:MAG: hypothetical protein M1819_006346 [Sarea resinae]|nr:MAG: hypothetical protein M1819_006346 [Sarea resinae]
MKCRRRASPLILLLLPVLSSALAVGKVGPASAADETDPSVALPQAAREAAVVNSASSSALPDPQLAVLRSDRGLKDTPVDGKDGKPHAGPWVETAAERERKKTKAGDEEDALFPGKKPGPKPAKDTSTDGVTVQGPQIPETNNGVMDDPNRAGPKQGTTGTEGGVSEKNRDRKAQEGQTGEKAEMKPDPPKEAPPLPHSEQEKIKKGGVESAEKEVLSADDEEKPRAPGGLEKPTDLPNTPHSIPQPLPPTTPKKDDPLERAKSDDRTSITTPSTDSDEPEAIIHPEHSFFLSFTMILFSEIGDKTFLIAALMAMKHPRIVVFSAAFGALIAMTVLSAVLGHAVPTLIPKRYTNALAAILFLVFGFKMLREGYYMSSEEGVGEEMKEVEMELEEKEELDRKQSRRRSSISPYVLEAGRAGNRKSRSNSRLPSPRSPSSSPSRSPSPGRVSSLSSMMAGFYNLFSLLLSPAWVQTFVMTFLGEWGDRSQIATIAMAAGQDYWWVTGGAVSGHAICTAAAVLGGRAIAGRVSLRVVTLGGAIAFVAFGLIYMVEAIYTP